MDCRTDSSITSTLHFQTSITTLWFCKRMSLFLENLPSNILRTKRHVSNVLWNGSGKSLCVCVWMCNTNIYTYIYSCTQSDRTQWWSKWANLKEWIHVKDTGEFFTLLLQLLYKLETILKSYPPKSHLSLISFFFLAPLKKDSFIFHVFYSRSVSDKV